MWVYSFCFTFTQVNKIQNTQFKVLQQPSYKLESRLYPVVRGVPRTRFNKGADSSGRAESYISCFPAESWFVRNFLKNLFFASMCVLYCFLPVGKPRSDSHVMSWIYTEIQGRELYLKKFTNVEVHAIEGETVGAALILHDKVEPWTQNAFVYKIAEN